MKLSKRVFLLLALMCGVLVMTVAIASADDGDRLAIVSEETGMMASLSADSPACAYSADYALYLCPEPEPAEYPVQDPVAHFQARMRLGNGGLLLIPESTNDRVMALDPVTGDVIDPDYIPADPDNLSTPIQAILSAAGNTILVSDQIEDVVQEYDMDGNYLGVFAPAGGADTAILNNIRGIALDASGNLLVTVGSTPNDDAIAMFDTSGNYMGNFVANGAGGLNSPFDIAARDADWLVAGITSDAIHRYDLSGAHIGDLTPVDTFPEQVLEIGNGNVLVANFSGDTGVLEYEADGTFVGLYDAITGNRGVYELPNGNILTTNGSGVYEIDRAGNLVEAKYDGVSARFITPIVMEPPTAIELAAFAATVNADSTVTLNWTTASELDTMGYHVYRSADPYATMETAERVSAELIAATASAGSGATYQFTDAPASGTWYYFLSDVETSGVAGWHGPVSASAEAPTSAGLTDLVGLSGTSAVAVLLLAAVALGGFALLYTQRRIG